MAGNDETGQPYSCGRSKSLVVEFFGPHLLHHGVSMASMEFVHR
jgi:hypothetical protein